MEPKQLLWCSGVILLVLMISTAFTGYVFLWGQVSFWGTTVIISMVTTILITGQPIVGMAMGRFYCRKSNFKKIL